MLKMEHLDFCPAQNLAIIVHPELLYCKVIDLAEFLNYKDLCRRRMWTTSAGAAGRTLRWLVFFVTLFGCDGGSQLKNPSKDETSWWLNSLLSSCNGIRTARRILL